jgi:hypothetical protein
MSKSDRLVEAILSKTDSGKLKWSGYHSKVGETLLSLSIEDDRPELAVQTDEATAYFDGPTVNELFKEVERLPISDNPDLLKALRDL